MLKLRIKRGLRLSQVCRLLPIAKNKELSGYIAAACIYYQQDDAILSFPDWSKPLSFHTHPVGELPSEQDIYAFLTSTATAHVVVGKEFAWIFRHTKRSREIGNALSEWGRENGLRWMSSHHWHLSSYVNMSLRRYGYRIAKNGNMRWVR